VEALRPTPSPRTALALPPHSAGPGSAICQHLPGYFEVRGQPDALVAAGGHRTGRTRPANCRPMIACRTTARHHEGAIGGPSCRLAPVSLRPSGAPHASVARWRFVPGMPQSVGFGRLTGLPLFGRDDGLRPDAPGSGRSYRPRASGADGASNRAAGRDADAVQPLPSRRPASSSTRPSPVTAGPRNGVSRDRADASRPNHGAQARQGTGSRGTRRATTRPWRDAAGQNGNF
jgi:hypothetical protein